MNNEMTSQQALEQFDILEEECKYAFGGTANGDRVRKALPVIKKALNDYARMQKVAEHSVKAYYRTSERFLKIFEKKDQLLKVLKNKRVNLEYVKCCETYEQYKTICSYWNEITETEFNLIKEWLNNGK